MTTWRRFGRTMVCLAAVSALAACADDGNDAGGADDSSPTDSADDGADDGGSGGERAASADDGADDGPAVSNVTQPTVPLPDCDVASEIDAPADWPHPIPDLLRLQIADVADRETYRLEGVTNDADGLVIAAMDTMFPDLEVTEPTGDASSIELEFSSAASDATVEIDDADGDGCWNVTVAVTYVEPPDTGAFDSTPTSVPSFEFDEATAVGRAQVITARGTFTLFVMRCSVDPVDIDAAGLDGALTITGSPGDLDVSWTYADGAVIDDDSPNVVGVDSAGGALFAEGDGPDGPESLIIEYFCE